MKHPHPNFSPRLWHCSVEPRLGGGRSRPRSFPRRLCLVVVVFACSQRPSRAHASVRPQSAAGAAFFSLAIRRRWYLGCRCLCHCHWRCERSSSSSSLRALCVSARRRPPPPGLGRTTIVIIIAVIFITSVASACVRDACAGHVAPPVCAHDATTARAATGARDRGGLCVVVCGFLVCCCGCYCHWQCECWSRHPRVAGRSVAVRRGRKRGVDGHADVADAVAGALCSARCVSEPKIFETIFIYSLILNTGSCISIPAHLFLV